MAMNRPPGAGGAPAGGAQGQQDVSRQVQQGVGGEEQRVIEQLRQMDQQQLISLVLQMRRALQEAQARQQTAGQPQQGGGQAPTQQGPVR